MRILLDAKDLIELVERSKPLSVGEFSNWLKERDGVAVLTFTNVLEFANCFDGVGDLLYIRSMVQALESLPLTYMHESVIEVSEIELAIEAFNSSTKVSRHSPYVLRWDETAAIRGESAPGEMMVGYRLDMMVFDLLKESGSELKRRQNKLALLANQAVIREREIPPDQRLRPREAMTVALGRKIKYWQLPEPKDMMAFGKWVYADATRCPGFRVAWELFRAVVANEQDALAESDLWDNVHFPAIPYVEFITLDRRMTGHCREVSGRLAKQSPRADYRQCAYRNLDELLVAIS